ncbi:uncharacterized protein LOC135128440 [Zophobas morio]|uniref:uncharacterized protein LOC135128440 n=1 Tax=Zophobas morio TaxID=2755281 RepID=UPI0030827E0C
MNSSLWIIWVYFIFLNFSESFGCCNSCTSDCCTSCCSNCQQQCNTAQCINTCQSNCCSQTCVQSSSCGQSQSCCNNIGRDRSCSSCSQSQDCSTNDGRFKSCTCPPERVINGGDSGRSTQSHEGSLTANISSNNVVNNHNILNLTIGVNSNVVNNIKNEIGGMGGGGGNGSTNVVTKVVPVVVKVPTNGHTPVPPTPHPPVPPPQPPMGCCIIVRPCIRPNCNPYHYTCQGCHGSYGYLPVNPCEQGCYKRDSWTRHSCTMGRCFSRNVDCSYCHEDFYQSYQGYSQCHGCFY